VSNPFMVGPAKKTESGNPFVTGPSGPRQRSGTSLPELRATAADLQQQVDDTGARTIEDDRPGALSRIIDMLSRPNYAIAGFAEEVMGEKPSVERGVKRALAEMFSGVGGVQGEKRAFGEVLENLGAGTKTLADAFPALEGTWVGAMGSRGAAGIALDIATDPLTYMTFGASTGARIATSKGVRFLNKSGFEKYNSILKKHLGDTSKMGDASKAIEETRFFDSAVTKAEKEFEEVFGVGGEIAGDLLEKGGAKLFGATIPYSDQLGKPLHKALNMLPESISRPAVEGAAKMRLGMMRGINQLFSPHGALSNLPDPIKSRAVRLTNSFFRSSIRHRAHLMSQADPLEKIYRKLEKADPGIGKRWHRVREGDAPLSSIKSAEELDAYKRTMALYDSMGETLVEHGAIPADHIIKRYIYHQYKNIEDLAQYHPSPGVKIGEGHVADFQKERKFATTLDAEEQTAALHAQKLAEAGKGEADRLYPALEVDYDVFGNMRKYVGKHSEVLARKAWREEMVGQFGKQLDELGISDADMDALYKAKVKMGEIPDPATTPVIRAKREGDIERTIEKTFGPDGAQYVAVKGKHTGDELVYLPKAINEAMESVSSRLFNTREYKEFGKLLKGFDWLNNNFKWGVYTIWPASAARDGYSNLFLSGLRIGLAAVDPKKHMDAVLMMAGRSAGKEFAGSGYTLGQLRELAKTFGVNVPGQVFVEQTGKFKLGKFRKAWTEKRALIENEARVLLWMEEIRHGVDPRTAADTVGQFLFNYGEVSAVERDLFRRLIPFYTFTRKNVELQWKMLKQNPGRVINQAKPFRGYNSENEEMVRWEGEALKLRLDKDGKTLHALTGIDLPLRNLDTLWSGGVGSTGRRLMGMLTPVLKVPLEMVTDRDMFTGRDLKRTNADTLGRIVEATHTPKGVRDWLGYQKTYDDAGRPRYTMDGQKYSMLVRSWMFSRAFSTSDRMFRENYLQGDNISRGMLDFLTGIRAKQLNMDDQEMRKLQTRIRQLKDSLVRRGEMREFTRAYTPKERSR